MNFLNFLTSGIGLFNSNLQNMQLNNNLSSLMRSTPVITIKGSQSQPQHKPSQTLHKNIVISQPSDNILPPCPSSQTLLPTVVQTQLLTHQQQLINQYMHLHLQLISKKIQNLQHSHQKTASHNFSNLIDKKQQPSEQSQLRLNSLYNNKKKIKKINSLCGHVQRQHYAKGMCNNCYHKNGRNKKPWKCLHQKLYANGLCQNCYINKYNKMKREKCVKDQHIEDEDYQDIIKYDESNKEKEENMLKIEEDNNYDQRKQ